MALLKRWTTAAGLLAAVLAAPEAGRAQADLEIPVKAAFLHKLTLFVEWPAAAFAEAGSPLVFCVLNDQPFSRSLEEVITGEQVAGHKLTVERLGVGEDPAACHVLFIGRSERQIAPVLAAVRDAPVLTVGEQKGFLEAGGAVNFLLEDGKVRFEINQDAAGRAGLTMSSKLLRLAVRILPEPRGGG